MYLSKTQFLKYCIYFFKGGNRFFCADVPYADSKIIVVELNGKHLTLATLWTLCVVFCVLLVLEITEGAIFYL